MAQAKDTKPFSARFTIEVYEMLKDFAKEKGESMNDVVNKAVESYVKSTADPEPGQPVKPPAPKPEPGPAPAEIPEEILALPGRVEKLEEANARLNGTVKGLTAEMKTLSKTVNNFMMAYQTITAPSPFQKWGSFTEQGGAEKLSPPKEGKKKKVISKKPARKPKK